MAKPNKRKAKQAAEAKAAAETPEATRREFLAKMRNRAIGLGGLAVGGYFAFSYYEAAAAEYDLTRIGKGTPKVVQIHDPQCPICTALQREARAAVDAMKGDEMCLLIANIRTEKGRAFASAHGAGHVTLVLMDGDGRVVEIMEGRRDRAELQRRFERLVAEA
ncbi:MAG: hypothetical protein AAFN79_11440 [Pseudomonadota bacterium]